MSTISMKRLIGVFAVAALVTSAA
ncbi:MAG: hypothetical protein JWL86_5452, partial [Rhizobium sp.]|nr:hypothetical protein [Rhizobium sp.]